MVQPLKEAHAILEKGADYPARPHPESDSESPSSEAIKAQLERLLSSSRFASSPRCRTFLRYVVEAAIQGNVESLKERNLGIEVFKRDATYDTNANPIVRVAASEVRKKLAQYYFAPGCQGQIRIEIPVGSYVPEFSFPGPAMKNGSVDHLTETENRDAVDAPEEAVLVPSQAEPVRGSRRILFMSVGTASATLLCMGILVWRAMTTESALDKFWAPMITSRSPILLCLGEMRASHVELDPIASRNPGESAMPILGPDGIDGVSMPIADLEDSITLANVAGLLRSERKQLTIRAEASTSYEDLQKGPAVLVGALNNDWTLRLMRNMRFQFNQNIQTHEWWVSDQRNPGVKLGRLVLSGKVLITQDLLIIARILNPETKQPTIIVAGLAPVGTLAAGNLVTDPRFLKECLGSLPSNWQNRNIEILLSVNVIDGQPGPPRVVASVVW